MLESEISRQKEETASLKQQLVEGQSVERERKKLADKVDKLESKVSSQFSRRSSGGIED
jgi:homeobox protein cut-like